MYTNDLNLIANITTKIESLLHRTRHTERGIGLFVYADKKEFMYFKQDRTLSE